MDQQGRLVTPSPGSLGFVYAKPRTDLGTVASQYGLNDFEWGPIDVTSPIDARQYPPHGSALHGIRRGQSLTHALTGTRTRDHRAEAHAAVLAQDIEFKRRGAQRAGLERLRAAREEVTVHTISTDSDACQANRWLVR